MPKKLPEGDEQKHCTCFYRSEFLTTKPGYRHRYTGPGGNFFPPNPQGCGFTFFAPLQGKTDNLRIAPVRIVMVLHRTRHPCR